MGIICNLLVLYDLFHEHVKKDRYYGGLSFLEKIKKRSLTRPLLKMTRTGFEPVLPP